MDVRILGPLEVWVAGGPLALGGTKQRAVLAMLALHANQVVAIDQLIDGLWGQTPPDGATNVVQVYVSRLRKTLHAQRSEHRTDRPEGQAAAVLARRTPGYLLHLDPDELDLARFERLTDQGTQALHGAPELAAARLRQALRLWRGPPLAEFTNEPFALAERTRLAEQRLAALQARIEADLALGRHGELVGELQALVAEYPLREGLHQQLLLSLYRSGRQAEALEAYQRTRKLLAEELGIDPGHALQGLQAAILMQDPDLDWTPPSKSTPTAEPAIPTAPSGTTPSSTIPAGVATLAGDLPMVVPELIGRDATLAEVGAALGKARMVTLTGPGGVGKTHLALHAVGTVGSASVDGVWLCELAATADPGAVPAVVATALQVQQRQGLTVTESLVEFLRRRRSLLVIDNCEHLLIAAARLVAAITSTCPDVAILATSREPLGIAGERVVTVPPLAVPPPAATGAERIGEAPAVALFCQRAAAVAPSFRLDEGNAVAVAEIARRLDGLPLAIELAATRMRSMSPAEVAERLSARFRLLGRAHGADQRHRTLSAVVDWSYTLLGQAEQHVFDRLSVFAGDFTLPAAEQVAAGGDVDIPEVAGLLATLVDKSMVDALPSASGKGTRYALLETLREYGRERLAERGETDATHRAHAEHYTAFAETADAHLGGPDEADWVKEVAAELDNLRAAHTWALEQGEADLALRLPVALLRYAEFRLTSELFTWAERAAEMAGPPGHLLLPVAWAMAAVGFRFRGQLDRAAALGERGLTAAGGPDDPLRWPALKVLSQVALFEGRLDEAARASDEANRLSLAVGDPAWSVWTAMASILSRAYGGDAPRALAQAEQVNHLAERVGNPTAMAFARYARGEILLDTEPDRAATLLQESIALAQGVQNRYVAGIALVSLASLCARHGDPHDALPLFSEVIEHWRQAGNWPQQWTTLRSVVTLLIRMGADQPAAILYGALTTAATATSPFGADADRLTEARRVLKTRLGSERFAALTAQGSAMTDEDVVAFAYETIVTGLPVVC
jgi:predicted ATPase/DNA-binding SARP family transcriptional activator